MTETCLQKKKKLARLTRLTSDSSDWLMAHELTLSSCGAQRERPTGGTDDFLPLRFPSLT